MKKYVLIILFFVLLIDHLHSQDFIAPDPLFIMLNVGNSYVYNKNTSTEEFLERNNFEKGEPRVIPSVYFDVIFCKSWGSGIGISYEHIFNHESYKGNNDEKMITFSDINSIGGTFSFSNMMSNATRMSFFVNFGYQWSFLDFKDTVLKEINIDQLINNSSQNMFEAFGSGIYFKFLLNFDYLLFSNVHTETDGLSKTNKLFLGVGPRLCIASTTYSIFGVELSEIPGDTYGSFGLDIHLSYEF